ncbi:MAG: YbjQ family protein [Planctomycetota bacterium]
MIVVTTEQVPGRRMLAAVGIAKGTAIRTRHLGHDFIEWLRNLFGGELDHYVKMFAETREQALDRLRQDARRLGADAVVGLRFETSKIASGAAEVLVYGTAVRLCPASPAGGHGEADARAGLDLRDA